MPLSPAQIAEIEAQRNKKCETIRESSPALEALLYKPLPVLDHGFVRVIDYMGTDSAIVQAARVSYGAGTKKVNEDAGLINYLLRHRHTTPFEMCEIKFHIKLPIFIARQWIRHRTANVNEYSGRYSIMDKEFYIPQPEHLAAQSTTNRQGRGEVLEGAQAARVLEILKADSVNAYAHYEEMMNCDEEGNIFDESKPGLARELARMNLPVNFYTQWYWKIDLHNLMHFLALRADSHAQYEIRAYANVMLDVLKAWVPVTYQAFMDYRMGGASISAKGLDAIRRMIAGQQVTQENSGMSKGEWREFTEVLKLDPQKIAA
ncbi:MAG: FAD-dependent thymidylate synthase [Alphaproteobacteria bacterium]|nr:FAD-dependent thymidylate synthase [Alphaproteobacteria bacterium]